MKIAPFQQKILMIVAVVALLGPNALYLYALFKDPSLNVSAMQNPVALAFMIEAMMLLGLFLWYVWIQTQSIAKVMTYLILSFIGSLAFSFPYFLYRQNKKTKY
ncbi:MAG: hypothetical protein M9962_12455 [Oligoflexia bacterium]|nr:hypothetical protein [Oligoflexia bacterium]